MNDAVTAEAAPADVAPEAAPSISDPAPTADPLAPAQEPEVQSPVFEGMDKSDPETGQESAKPETSGSGDTPSPTNEPLGYFPENWRETWAGEDQAYLNILNRYKSPADAVKALKEAKDFIARGDQNKAPDENSSEEEWKAWREQKGVPEEADGYAPDIDRELTDRDKLWLAPLSEVAHKHNMSNDEFSDFVRSFQDVSEQAQQDRVKMDEYAAYQFKQDVKAMWGPDEQTNHNLVQSFLMNLPEESRWRIQNARDAEGKGLFVDTEFLNAIVDLQREANPHVAIIPNTDNPGKSIADEKAEIRSRMGTDEYTKEDQKRYGELLVLEEKLEARKAA